MNFARTCHHALSVLVAKTRGDHVCSPAEDLYIATAHQRLEESARMLAAMRRAAAYPRTDDLTARPRVLALDGHRISRYTGAPVAAALRPAASQSQAASDVTHAA